MDGVPAEATQTPVLLDDGGGDLIYLFVYCYYWAQATLGWLCSAPGNLTNCNKHDSESHASVRTSGLASVLEHRPATRTPLFI